MEKFDLNTEIRCHSQSTLNGFTLLSDREMWLATAKINWRNWLLNGSTLCD